MEGSFTTMGWYDNDMGAAGWVFMIAAMMICWSLVAIHTSSGITGVGDPRGPDDLPRHSGTSR